MNRYSRLTASLIVLASVQLPAEGANDEDLAAIYGDEEMISIATGLAQPISKAPAVASVITAADIKKMGATDIDDALEAIPGLHVARNATGYAPVYTFRGIHSEFNPQVLMLVNGIPLTNLFQGDRGLIWGGMPIEAISRIEVIRGPGSAIYGADAFAGVINIITKNPTELSGLEGGGRAGSFNTKDAWLQYGGANGELRYGAIVEAHKTDGQNERVGSDAQSFLDLISGTSASLAPGAVNLERENIDARFEVGYQHLTFRTGAQIREGQLGIGTAQALDPEGEGASKRFNADLTYDNPQFTDNFSLKAQASTLFTTQEVNRDLVIFPPGSRGPFFDNLGSPLLPPFPNGVIGNPEVYERHHRGNLTGIYHGFERHELMAGTGYYIGEIYQVSEEKNFGIDPGTGFPILPGSPLVDVSDTPVTFLKEGRRENTYTFIQDVWRFANDWEFTGGVRYDHYSDFGDTTNPRLALVWSARQNLTVKALYGEAFRAPSFAETGAQANPAILGNPKLRPETLKSYELAFNYRPAYNLTTHLNLFKYVWKDIIQFVPDAGGGTRTAQNAGEQNGHGFEFETTWAINETFAMAANFAWQQSTDESVDRDAGNAPEKEFYVRFDWRLPDDWTVNLQTNWIMGRNRVFNDPRPAIDDYAIVDVNLRKARFLNNWEFALLAKNIFDEDAREPSLNGSPVPLIPGDLPLGGRSLLGELRYHF